MRVVTFSTTFAWNIFHSKKKLSKIWSKMYIHIHVKCLLCLSDFNKICTFLKDLKKKFKYKISWKFIQWEPSGSMQTDRHSKVNSPLLQVCKHTYKLANVIHVLCNWLTIQYWYKLIRKIFMNNYLLFHVLALHGHLHGELSCKGIHFNIKTVKDVYKQIALQCQLIKILVKGIKYKIIRDALHIFTDLCWSFKQLSMMMSSFKKAISWRL